MPEDTTRRSEVEKKTRLANKIAKWSRGKVRSFVFGKHTKDQRKGKPPWFKRWKSPVGVCLAVCRRCSACAHCTLAPLRRAPSGKYTGHVPTLTVGPPARCSAPGVRATIQHDAETKKLTFPAPPGSVPQRLQQKHEARRPFTMLLTKIEHRQRRPSRIG